MLRETCQASAEAPAKKKPLRGLPIFEYQDRGFKWVIENQTLATAQKEFPKENGVLTVDISDPKQQVYLYNCEGITVKVNGKFKYDPRSPQIDGMVDSVLQLLATPFRSFYDTPWYMLYRSLDEYFPGSKFILTLRRDAMTQALSDWNHNRTLGKCHGDMPEAYGEEQMRVYVEHNAAVLQYFQDRPDDLLTVCWEAGDSWNKVCDFLGVPVPDITFPHKLKGNYSKG